MQSATITQAPGKVSQRSVCVVVTTYDHAHFLADALDSIVAQTTPVTQIVVVDDGSADGPDKVAARYARVQFVRQKNQGLAAARNTGLRHAKADMVVFLDADDVLLESAIQSGLDCFTDHPDAGFVYGAYRMVDEKLMPTSDSEFRPLQHGGYQDLLYENIIGMHGTVMYDRAKLEHCDGFDESLIRCEDYDAYFRMALRYPPACHRTVVADYRIHHGNMSSDPVEMLEWALAVQGRYRPPDDELALLATWRKGRQFLKTCYANEAWKDRPERSTAQKRVQRIKLMQIAPKSSVVAAIWQTTRRYLPRRVAGVLKKILVRRRGPAVGQVDLGDLCRTTPISRQFGFDRGTPVDRYYIEKFLSRNSDAVTGRVLEVGDASYSCQFGTGISRQDILHFTEGNPVATIVGDLSQTGALPNDSFDCMIVTQTLQLIYDMQAAVQNMKQGLHVGGSLLLTVPGISAVHAGEPGDGWFWSLTGQSVTRMFSEIFGPENIEVSVYGNVYSATTFLHGVALEEINPAWLDRHDPAYPVIVAVHARRAD